VQCVKALDLSSPDACVTALHIAPCLGRKEDLIAVAHGACVDVFSVSGDTTALRVDRIASLPHAAAVWKAEWSIMGTYLAVSSDEQLVSLWQMDLRGQFSVTGVIKGSPDA
jgi:hypothetical protein